MNDYKQPEIELKVFNDEVPLVDNGFYTGQIVMHKQLGKGVIVGFSEVTSEPAIYFFDKELQRRYNDRVVTVDKNDVISYSQFETLHL